MYKNYFKIAWRNLRKSRLYTFVNIIGLTVGITSCILIGLYIAHELSYDRFHKKNDRIVRLTSESGGNGDARKNAVSGTGAGPRLSRTFPEIEAFTRTIRNSYTVAYEDKVFNEKGFLFADSAFFRIFSFELVKGDAATVLNAPNQVVITGSMAKKYFGNSYPIGKVLKISGSRDYTVTGIVKDPPDNSQIRFNFVASFTSLGAAKTEEWWTQNYVTYLLLKQEDQRLPLEQRIAAFMKTDDVRKEAGLTGIKYLTYHLEPLKKVHLYSALDGLEPNGNITYIYILGAIALLILLIACVNYTNLATAQSESRRGEISVRKVLGAQPGQLFAQYLGESVLLTFIALFLAILLSIQLLPLFNQLSNKSLNASSLLSPLPLLALFLLGALVSLLAGAYPAFILSNQRLMSILRSGFRTSSSGGALRKSLIVFQFMISVFLMVSTMVIFRQLSYIQHKALGYDKEHVIVLPVDNKMHKDYDALKQAIRLDPQVLAVGGSYESPTFVRWGDAIHANIDGVQKDLSVNAIPADLDFIPTMRMQLAAGENFTNADLSKMDTSNDYQNYRYTFILNESAVKALGWTPEQAIGKSIRKNLPGIVKGVVKDFHSSSLHQAIGPLAIFLDTGFIYSMYVRVSGNNIPATLSHLQALWKERVPYRPFEYRFLDEDYNALYKTEVRTGQILGTFSATAILLACLGLFALAAYTTAQRTKEIGIRKVLGATLLNITGLLSADFLRLVVIATLIAFPLAWWAMHNWLEGFAYRITISWMIFAGAAVLSIGIALGTVSFQAIRAALANPVKSLRSE